jgi:hypothetical protein
MDQQYVLQALLKFELDESQAKRAADLIRQTGKATEEARQKFARMREDAEKLGDLGVRIGALGAAIAGPLVAAMLKYNAQVGLAEASSTRWITANQKIEQSTLRIGRVASESLVPAIEMAADAAEKLAGFLEKNPELVKVALGVGGTLTAAGGGLMLAAQLKSSMATLGLLGQGGLLAKAGTAVGGFAGSAAGAAMGGLAAGFGVNELLASRGARGEVGGIQYSFQNFNKYLTVGAGLLGGLFGKTTEWASAVGKATGAIDKMAGVVEKSPLLGENKPIVGQAGAAAYLSFKEGQAAADAQYRAQKEQEAQNLIEQTGEIEERTAEQRVRTIRDFEKSRRADEDNTNEERLKRAAAYGEEILRMEQDHQRDMRRMTQDHGLQMEQLIAKRDFAGAYWQQRRFEMERARTQEDFAINAERKNKDFAIELRDAEDNLKKRREVEKKSMDDALEELDAQKDNEIGKLKSKHKDLMTALDTAYTEENEKRLNAFRNQMGAMGLLIGEEMKAYQAQFQQAGADLANALLIGLGKALGPKTSISYSEHSQAPELYEPPRSGGSGMSQSFNINASFAGMGAEDRGWFRNAFNAEFARTLREAGVAQ